MVEIYIEFFFDIYDWNKFYILRIGLKIFFFSKLMFVIIFIFKILDFVFEMVF